MSEPQTRPLSSYIRVKHGFAFSGAEFSDDPSLPTLVTPGNFAIGGGFKEARTKTYAGDYPSEYKLSTGDLIISMTDLSKEGDTLGLPAVVPEGDYLHNQRVGLVEIVAPECVDSRFLAYFLRTSSYRAHILGTASGSTVRHTSPSRIGSFETSLPPLHEQHAIAEVLGALDEKIATNMKLAGTASTLAGLIYDQAIAGIESQPMSQVLHPVLGGTPPRSRSDFWDGEQLWASARDITGAEFGVVTDTEEKITDLAVTSTKAKPLPKGSVVLTARGTVGAVARLAVPASFNQSCYGFVPGVVPPGVLFFAICRATERAKEIAHGSVFDTITMKTFDHLAFPKFGSRSISEAESKIGPLLESVSAAVTENANLAATRNALLPHLMSSRLRVKDAEKVLEDAGV
jgi:type I restriction enzyme S subunit